MVYFEFQFLKIVDAAPMEIEKFIGRVWSTIVTLCQNSIHVEKYNGGAFNVISAATKGNIIAANNILRIDTSKTTSYFGQFSAVKLVKKNNFLNGKLA